MVRSLIEIPIEIPIGLQVNLNVGDYDARTALHLAASNGCLEATSWLLQQESVDKSPVDRVLGTPLSDALRHNRTVRNNAPSPSPSPFPASLVERSRASPAHRPREHVDT